MNLLLKNIRWEWNGLTRYGDVRIQKRRVVQTGIRLGPQRHELQLDLSGHVALPGLINAHDHLDFNLFPHLGRPPYASFYEWARDVYRPDQPPVQDILRVSRRDRLHWGALKQLLSGVTTVAHHDTYYREFRHRYPVNVVRRYGWTHSLGYGRNIERAFRRSRRRPFIIHAAEGIDPLAAAEIDRLDALGLLTPRTVLVHAVALDSKAITLIARRGCSVVWCPSSNLHLFGETSPVEALLAAGVRVALGTDSTLSGSATLWDELQAAADTGLASHEALLRMVTANAASILQLHDGRGTLRTGVFADITVVRNSRADVPQSLIDASPSTLALVLVDGAPRVAAPEIAAFLGLGPPNVSVDGTPLWLEGNVAALRERIEAMVHHETLERNPLWRSLRPISRASRGKPPRAPSSRISSASPTVSVSS